MEVCLTPGAASSSQIALPEIPKFSSTEKGGWSTYEKSSLVVYYVILEDTPKHLFCSENSPDLLAVLSGRLN